ncbi:MAG: ankyrin repeat domain-containing protein [Pseudomonadota bacterium]
MAEHTLTRILVILLVLASSPTHAARKRAPDLCVAVASGKLAVAERALRTSGSVPKARCGKMPLLHHAILKGAAFEVILAIVHAGVDVNQPGQAGDTPLLLAVRMREADLIKLLVQYGADPTRTNAAGLSAVNEAEQIGRTALLEALGVPVERPVVDAGAAAARAADAINADAGATREDAHGVEDGSAAVAADRADASAADAHFNAFAHIPGSDVATGESIAPVALPDEPDPGAPRVEEEPPPPEPVAPGPGRKILLFFLVAGGIILAMRLILRLLG